MQFIPQASMALNNFYKHNEITKKQLRTQSKRRANKILQKTEQNRIQKFKIQTTNVFFLIVRIASRRVSFWPVTEDECECRKHSLVQYLVAQYLVVWTRVQGLKSRTEITPKLLWPSDFMCRKGDRDLD